MPTASGRPSRAFTATTDGSFSTTPRPRRYTSVFAVPRSIAMSRPTSGAYQGSDTEDRTFNQALLERPRLRERPSQVHMDRGPLPQLNLRAGVGASSDRSLRLAIREENADLALRGLGAVAAV